MPTNKQIFGDYYVNTVPLTANVYSGNIHFTTDTVKVNGNLDVLGNLTYINVSELNIQDPFILLNSSNTNSYSDTSGVLVHKNATEFAGIRYSNIGGLNRWQISVDTNKDGTGDEWILIFVPGDDILANNISATGNVTVDGDVSATNLDLSGSLTANGDATANRMFSLGIISAVSTITGGNLVTSGVISATGNIDAGSNVNVTGDIAADNYSALGNVTVDGTVVAASVIGNIFGNINAFGGNTAVQFSDQGVMNGSPAFTFDLASNLVTVTGNVISGNIDTGNISADYISSDLGISSLGNVIAPYFIGNLEGNVDGNVTGGGPNTAVQFNNSGIIDGSEAFTFDFTSNSMVVLGNISGANLDILDSVVVLGNVTAANITALGLVQGENLSAVGNITGNNIAAVGDISAGGNAVVEGEISANANITANGLLSGSNISTGGTVSAQDISVTDTANLGNLTIADTTISTVLANGNIVLEPTGNGLVVTDTVTGLLVPVGDTAERPSAATAGIVRFNTDSSRLEVSDGTGWEDIAANVTNQIIYGDGSTSIFVLDRVSTAAATLVAINGVLQLPGVAYTVTGNSLSLTQAPETTDVIDIRFL